MKRGVRAICKVRIDKAARIRSGDAPNENEVVEVDGAAEADGDVDHGGIVALSGIDGERDIGKGGGGSAFGGVGISSFMCGEVEWRRWCGGERKACQKLRYWIDSTGVP